jgi:hypothetical protein
MLPELAVQMHQEAQGYSRITAARFRRWREIDRLRSAALVPVEPAAKLPARNFGKKDVR